MDVKFVTTASTKLSELPIVNGQLIYLSDKNYAYYDVGGSRRAVSGMKIVASLPSTATVQEGVLYGLVNSSGQVAVSVWDASASTYRALSGSTIATTSSLGLVQPDGTTLTIDSNGVLTVSSLPSSAVTYNNQISGLSSTTAQGAFDEIVSRIVELENLADVALLTALPSTAS